MTSQTLRRPAAVLVAHLSALLPALLLLALPLALPLVAASPAAGAELHREFIEGLRRRGYYNTVDDYLDTLEQRTDIDPEFKKLIPYERGVTLLEGARTLKSAEQQDAQLDKAAGMLEAFVKANPDHPLVGKANAERGNILLGKARVKIWESQAPLNKGDKLPLQEEARQAVLAARDIFQKAHDKYKEVFAKFPTFIPAEEAEQLAARGKAEVDYMQAQINLAMCTYEEAQTYDRGSDPYKAKLTQAAGEFEQIHQKYRSMVGGLYARMWQGKCFEEQDEIGRALGIYNELLEHGDGKPSPSLRVLQDQVRSFRFICLNHRSRHDYQLVIDEAGAWLSDSSNRQILRTSTGLGIRWQKALAHEARAGQLKAEKAPAAEVERQLRAALSEAREITPFSGQYKDVSQRKVQQLMAQLNIQSGPPESFDEAIGLAEIQVKKIEEFQTDVEAARQQKLPKTEIANRELVLEGHIRQTADTLEQALRLAEPDTSSQQLNRARMLLSYCYLQLERPLEAGVIAEFVTTRSAPEETENAQQAAQVAMGAYVSAYNRAAERQEGEKDPDTAFELDQLLRVCQDVAQRWPESSLADDSRMTVGRIYTRRDMPGEAAAWFGKVPQGADHYGLAQINAGQAYWDAYRNTVNKATDATPPEAELQKLEQWKQSAQEYLERGIKEVAQQTPAKATVQEATDLIAAKATLAQIMVTHQKFAEAIALLQTAPHAPLDAVRLEVKGPRPSRGIQSESFASLVYQLLLRSYVGTQNIEAALKTMDDLERVVGGEGGGGEEVTRIYVQLGRQIQEALDLTKKAGPPERFQEMLASFDQFLTALDAKRATMSYGSLQWMGETYRALGNTLEGDAKGKQYFTRAAATYKALLDKAAGDQNPPKGLVGIQLRLSTVYGEAGEFEKALAEIDDILKTHPNALEVQVSAAELLQKWGASGRTDAPQYFKQAIGGRGGNKAGGIWGWAGIANRLRQQLTRINGSTEHLIRDLEVIYAAERNTKRKDRLQADLASLKADGAAAAEVQAAQEKLAVITDAETATQARVALQAEIAKTEAAKSPAATDAKAEAARLKTLQKLNAKLRNFVTENGHAQKTFGRLLAARQELDQLEKEQAPESAVEAARDRLRTLRDAVRAPEAKLDQKEKILQELQQAEAQADGPRGQLLDALYHISESRRDFAKQQSSSDAKAKELKAAQTEMLNLTRFVQREHIPDARWKNFNNLYAEIQRELTPQITPDKIETLPVTADAGDDLTWPERTATPEAEAIASNSQKAAAGAVEEKPVEQGTGMVGIIIAGLVGLGLAGGVIYLLYTSSKKKVEPRVRYAAAAPTLRGDFGGIGEVPSFGPAFDIGDQPRKAAPRPAAVTKKPVPKKPAAAGAAPQPVAPQPAVKKPAPKPAPQPVAGAQAAAPKPAAKPAPKPAAKPAPQPVPNKTPAGAQPPQAVRPPAAPPPKPAPPRPAPPQAQPPKPPGAE